MAEMQLLHGGIANAWECDENAHLNVRGYVHKSWEGLQILLAISRSLAIAGQPAQLVIATCDAVEAASGQVLDDQQGGEAGTGEICRGWAHRMLWGFARTLAQEHRELTIRLLDVDERGSWFAALAAELADIARSAKAGNAEARHEDHPVEPMVAWRDGERLVPRLAAIEPADGPTIELSPDKYYVITGASGGLGKQLVAWMSERGATRLVLISRSIDISQFSDLEISATELRCRPCDVANAEELAVALAWNPDTSPPDDPRLGGVIHAAGVLKDGFIVNQDWAAHERVLAAKLDGAWNLHQATMGRDLDFFVCFSSAAALLGSRGQASYAAANAAIDGLCAHRRALGLAATSINRGPWQGRGMAASVEHRVLQSLPPEQALGALASHGAGPHVQLAAVKLRWDELAGTELGADPLLADLERPSSRSGANRATSPSVSSTQRDDEDRDAYIARRLREITAAILRMEPETIDMDAQFQDLGVDSMMATEIKEDAE
ncbi:MAG: beta-ketoacyl reductase, partial [Myxococcota bacterium]